MSVRAFLGATMLAGLVAACGNDDVPLEEGVADLGTHESGCEFVSPGTVRVTSECLDAEWPLVSNEAEVFCSNGGAMLRVPHDDEGAGVYPLTGQARQNFPDPGNAPDVAEVAIADPETGGHANVGSLTAIARDLC